MCIDTTTPQVRFRPTATVVAIDDAAAELALRLRRVPVANRAMYTLSWLGDDGRVWIAAAALQAARASRPSQTFSHATGWLAMESLVVNKVVKRMVRRARPVPLTEHEHRLRIPHDTSFPSGHASSAATMATILWDGGPLGVLWAALAAGIGASRVHVGVHHGSDVLAGWAIGVAFGLVARRTRR